jgi:hypothetical protein
MRPPPPSSPGVVLGWVASPGADVGSGGIAGDGLG